MLHTLTKPFFFLLFTFSIVGANIQVIKKENKDSNTTLLVIAGIHGNEPGSYFAASILATHYNITSKNLWIVPNLNEESIRKNKRGINGDMNRKFSLVNAQDKDKNAVEGIKKLILSKNVSLVLNLHDGHGFYRKDFQGKIFNPNAWGQTCVIDQCKLNQNQEFGNLNAIASEVKNHVNTKLLKKHHAFDVRNTKTKYEDEQMQLSLTYFAVTNNKPAFAIESSKSLSSLSQKVYYQLLSIEKFMNIMGIGFQRNFDLNEKTIADILNNHGILRINNNISLNLSNIKKSLSFIPIKSNSNEFNFSHPLGSIMKVNGKSVVFIGNKKITTLSPQYFQIAKDCPDVVELEIDGLKTFRSTTKDFFVNDDFKVIRTDNIRVNVIGYAAENVSNESGIVIHRNELQKNFSLDRNSKQFRIEFYKKDKFCSMSVVHFK